MAAKMSADHFYAQLDHSRGIDILFYGNSNEHREEVFAEFSQLAITHNLRVEFRMGYNLFGSYRDGLIDQAKVSSVCVGKIDSS